MRLQESLHSKETRENWQRRAWVRNIVEDLLAVFEDPRILDKVRGVLAAIRQSPPVTMRPWERLDELQAMRDKIPEVRRNMSGVRRALEGGQLPASGSDAAPAPDSPTKPEAPNGCDTRDCEWETYDRAAAKCRTCGTRKVW